MRRITAAYENLLDAFENKINDLWQETKSLNLNISDKTSGNVFLTRVMNRVNEIDNLLYKYYRIKEIMEETKKEA